MTTDELLLRYTTSYFQDRTCGGWFDANDAGRKSGDRSNPMLIDNRAVGGMSVPLANGRELVALMIENVEECRQDVKLTGERLQRAKRDGLLNKKAFREEDEETQERWIAAIETVRGDYSRALAEMKHWQTYANLASEGQLPVLKNNAGTGTELIKALAEAKSIEPDRRLPPEPDDETEPPF